MLDLSCDKVFAFVEVNSVSEKYFQKDVDENLEKVKECDAADRVTH